ncbi:MAG: hypothetical protein KUG65_00735 [Sphingomonadaceae bacterium]|nr:hypothetical protein [Sphingomonadaceae bacterium]
MRNRLLRISSLVLTVAAVMNCGPIHAATQGALGETSTGSITISVSVASRAQISGLSDVSLHALDPAMTAIKSQNVCVWSNTPSRTYRITASGSGAGNSFSLANGPLTTPYSVAWNTAPGQTAGVALTAGTSIEGLVSTATERTCASGSSGRSSLIVSIASSDLEGMQPETNYLGLLRLIVTPE